MKHSTVISKNTFSSPLREQLYRFLEMKRAAGYKYREEQRCLFVLDKFLKSVLIEGPAVISYEIAKQYLTRWEQENDTTRSHRLSLLRQFCRFMVLEEPRTFVPPRRFMGIKRCSFTPRILTRGKGRRFVAASLTFLPAHCSPLRGVVLGVALLVLYLTGLRAGEVLRLTVGDVDFEACLLRVRESKFAKSRYVPLAADLVEHLRLYCNTVGKRLGQRHPDDPFFCTSKGKPYSMSALRAAFRQTLDSAGIAWMGKGQGPRMHDLRHNAAVLRMLLCMRRGSISRRNCRFLQPTWVIRTC